MIRKVEAEGLLERPEAESVCFWLELQCHAVDAESLASRPGPIREHMAQVGFTLLAYHLGTR